VEANSEGVEFSTAGRVRRFTRTRARPAVGNSEHCQAASFAAKRRSNSRGDTYPSEE
jgi:hypothetical protein